MGAHSDLGELVPTWISVQAFVETDHFCLLVFDDILNGEKCVFLPCVAHVIKLYLFDD